MPRQLSERKVILVKEKQTCDLHSEGLQSSLDNWSIGIKEDAKYEAEMVESILWKTLFVMLNSLAARSHAMIRSIFWKDNWKVLG